MPRYTDELDAIIAYEQDLRRKIVSLVAEEAGTPIVGEPSERQIAAAEEAIESWRNEGESHVDLRAFRPMGPLQQLLAAHRAACDRIDDMLDRRLS